MANLQPLDLGCTIAARDTLSTDDGLIVTIYISHASLQQAQRMLEYRRPEDEITLLHGDVTDLKGIGSLRSSANQSQPVFDVVFALCSEPSQLHPGWTTCGCASILGDPPHS